VLAAGSPGSPDGPDGWPVERANAVNVAAPSSSSSCNASRPAFDVSVSARLLREDRRFSAELPNRVIQCNSVSRPRSRAPARPTTLPDQTNRISSISPGEASAASSRDASATVRTVSWGAWYIYCGGGAGRGGGASPVSIFTARRSYRRASRRSRTRTCGTQLCVRTMLRPRASGVPPTTMDPGAISHPYPRVAVSHKRRKIEGRVTAALCNLSLRLVRVRPTRRGFHAARACLSVTELFTCTCATGRKESGGVNE